MAANLFHRIRKYHRRWQAVKGFPRWYRQVLDNADLRGVRAVHDCHEREWLEHWRHYDRHVSTYAYRIFSPYVGPHRNIAPLELIAAIVEPVLNPQEYLPLHQDKNAFDRIYSGVAMPTTVLRNIDGSFFDGDYQPCDPTTLLSAHDLPDMLIVKPARGFGGEQITLLRRAADGYHDGNGARLDSDWLEHHYRRNYLLQHYVAQSDFMAHLNASSVNTIRIATYRDVHSDAVHLLGAVLRVGAHGNAVDNVHAGGRFVGIDLHTGMLGNAAHNGIGEKATCFNGVDYVSEKLCIPGWAAVLDMAQRTARCNPYHRLLALDIALDTAGRPLLIETNVEGFGAWVFQFTSGPVFGDLTDDIFDHCLRRYRELDTMIVYR